MVAVVDGSAAPHSAKKPGDGNRMSWNDVEHLALCKAAVVIGCDSAKGAQMSAAENQRVFERSFPTQP